MSPTPPNIWQAFQANNCSEMTCSLDQVRLGRTAISRLRECGKRQYLPFRFSGIYGTGKERVGVDAYVHRFKGDLFGFFIRWSRVPREPPEKLGRFADFVNCVASTLGDKEALVSAQFSYDREKVASVFSPIQMGSEAGIFDEIVGFAGIKRGAEGKLLYRLEVSFGAKRLEHSVIFFQTIRLSEELPLGLLDIATRISNLGLKKRE